MQQKVTYLIQANTFSAITQASMHTLPRQISNISARFVNNLVPKKCYNDNIYISYGSADIKKFYSFNLLSNLLIFNGCIGNAGLQLTVIDWYLEEIVTIIYFTSAIFW